MFSEEEYLWLQEQLEKVSIERRENIYGFYEDLFKILQYNKLALPCPICNKPIQENLKTTIYSVCGDCVDQNLTTPSCIVECIISSKEITGEETDIDYDKTAFINKAMVENSLILFDLKLSDVLEHIKELLAEKDSAKKLEISMKFSLKTAFSLTSKGTVN